MNIRKKRGFSQEQLAEKIGTNKRVISKYERDEMKPSIEVARSLAVCLEVSLDFLTGLDASLFIDDQELIHILKGYDAFDDEDKKTIKRLIEAFLFKSELQKKIAS